ncbi:MAG: hypothetical protein U9Q12_01450 [Patescibacteria group bacterium]|nr:hypothetical protein [Patescibacteria group bacterium]
MKKVFLFMMAMVVCASFAQAGSEKLTPGQEYFDQQFNKLQGAVAEVKGDTSQIVDILGNVFEGTVPSGGTLTGLCNKNGWNLIVLMGHNGIVNPNNVAADATFQYPSTAEEFQTALKRGRPLYQAWLKEQSTTFRVNRIKVDTAQIDKLNIRVAHITEELKIRNMKIDELKIRLAEVTEELRIKQLNINQLNVDQANFKQVNIDQLHIKQLEIDNLKHLCNQMRRRCAMLEARPPKVVHKEVVVYRDALGTAVGQGSCKDIPWPAVSSWADFPEGAIGTETQLRPEINGYKFKLVTRHGNDIYATKCFKDTRLWTLSELGQKWGRSFVPWKTFGNTGDGGQFATLVIGIAQ